MTPKKIDHKKLDPGRAQIYWAKAQDFFKTMRDAASAGNWNSVGLAAVHCAICASDAILVAKAGMRSTSKSHEDVTHLISQHIRHPEVKEQARRLATILADKNLIEYIDKSYTEKEALTIQKQVERYIFWVQIILNT